MRVCYAAVLALVLAREGRAAPILLPPSHDDLLAFSTLKPWLPVLPPPLNDTAAKPAPNGTTQHEADLSAAAELEKRCARLKKRGLFDCDEKAKAKTAKKKADKLRAKIEKFKANHRIYCAERSYGIMKTVELQESRLVKYTEDIATCKKWFADTDKDDKGKGAERVGPPVPAICKDTDRMIRDKERLPLDIKQLRTELGRPCPTFLD